ncbi:tail tube [Haloarcula tailed virus 2]|uniref:Tail tube n=1 Tax=Haloarcula tailed virus 2 TaxID=2877989 RepID=A0AAE9BZG5_9CAUD|nr:tail tube [Haloarcula tailed virus 2]UBF23171.1 tail tube [Haloarcula tailed virus 2]
MVEITNSSEVSLEIKSGVESLTLENIARVAVQDFNMTTSEDNQLVNGIGQQAPKGVTRGSITHEFSFSIQGEDANLLQAIALEEADGSLTGRYRSKEFQFVARGKSFKVKMLSGYLTELALDGSEGEAVEYSVSGVAIDVAMQPIEE